MTDRHCTVDPNASASEGLTDANFERTDESHEFGTKGSEKPDIQAVRENSAASGRSEITRPRVVTKIKSTPHPPQAVSRGNHGFVEVATTPSARVSMDDAYEQFDEVAAVDTRGGSA